MGIISRAIEFIFRPSKAEGSIYEDNNQQKVQGLVFRRLRDSKQNQAPIQLPKATTPKGKEKQAVTTITSRMFNDPKAQMLKRESTAMHRHLYGHVLDKNKGLHPHIKGGWGSESLHLARSLDDFANSLELNPPEIEFFRECAEQLKEACAISSFNELNPIQVHDKIQNLKLGESYLIHGYWKSGPSSSHAISYEIIRTETGFTLTIINTGDDEDASSTRVNSIVDKFQGKYQHKEFTIPSVSLELVANLIATGEDIKKSKETTLNDITRICTRLGGQEQPGRVHNPQNRGSCAQKRDKSWLKAKFIRKFGPIEGNRLHEKFKINYSKQLMAEVDEVERTMSKEQLETLYGSTLPELAISERQEACQRTLERQEKKFNRFAVYDRLKDNGWKLTDEEFDELFMLVRISQMHGQDPMEICQRAELWGGEKNWRLWRKFEEISDQLKRDGWELTDHEHHELAILIQDFANIGKKPVKINHLTANWAGDKTWDRLHNAANNLLSAYQDNQASVLRQEEKPKQFDEVYKQLQANGWNLTAEELKGLALLIQDFEDRGKDPMELCQLAEEWRKEILEKIELAPVTNPRFKELRARPWKEKSWACLRNLAVYGELKANSWDLTNSHLSTLATLAEDFEELRGNPMKLCQLAEKWKGEKNSQDLLRVGGILRDAYAKTT